MTLPSDVPVEPDRDQGRRWLQDELAEPVYAAAEPSLLERAVGRLLELLGAIEVPSGTGGSVLAAAVAVALLGLVVLAARFAGPLARGSRTHAGDVFTDSTTTADAHRALADRAAADGRWAEAVRERFRAVVRSLEERVVLDVRPGRTAHEAAAEAALALPDAAGALVAGADVFDDVVYGERPATAAADSRLRDLDALVARTRPALGREPTATPATPR